MPAPPMALSADELDRLAGVEGRAGGAADAKSTLPGAGEKTQDARGAVTEPGEETKARAEAAFIDLIGGRAPPDPRILELCGNIASAIREGRPLSEKEVYLAKPRAAAERVGKAVNSKVEAGAEQAGSEAKKIESPPDGSPQLTPEPVQAPPTDVATPDVRASDATPNAVPPENISLDNDVRAQDQKLAGAGMKTEPAQEATKAGEGPLAAAAEATGELQGLAAKDPAKVAAEQQVALETASGDMTSLQLRALAALQRSRETAIAGDSSQQGKMVLSEESQRKHLSERAEAIYRQAQAAVLEQLNPLPQKMRAKWDAKIDVASSQFEGTLKMVRGWIDERYRGFGGFFNSLGDAVFGLPDWVIETYAAAESQFGKAVCDAASEISSDVNTVVKTAEALIEQAEQQIAALFTGLDPSLETWAAGEKAKFDDRFGELRGKVQQTREELNRDLLERTTKAVEDARSKIAALREEAKGIIGKIEDAVGEFVADPARAIINGLLKLAGIPPDAFWAVVAKVGQVIEDIANDPLGFANNLAAALAQGFKQFFANVGKHLLEGLLGWLFSAMGSVGVSIPGDFSLKSVITFFLELMGITWPRIRELLAKHIGEENVALIEKTWAMVSQFLALGPEGIFELIKEQLNPQNILDMVLSAAIDFITQTLITQIAARIVLLFNPAGAIAQAIELVYRVLKWVFNNAARIFRLVETVVNGIADILSGDIGGMATAVETALAGLIAPVIDFLADYAGMGDLPEKIAGVVKGLQDLVLSALDKVIGFLASKAKVLLSKLGIGGAAPPGETTAGEGADGSSGGQFDGQIGKVVSWSAAGDSHRMWIVTTDAGTKVMMASTPEAIALALDHYQQGALRLRQTEPNEAARVEAFIREAQTKASALATNAAQVAKTAKSSKPGAQTSVAASDDKVEAAQDELAGLLGQIQALLGTSDSGEQLFTFDPKDYWKKKGRPGWRKSTDRALAELYPEGFINVPRKDKPQLVNGLHRRHIIAWSLIRDEAKQALDQKKFSIAAGWLALRGSAPANPPDKSSLEAAAKEYLADRFNAPLNLWPGQGAQNIAQQTAVDLPEAKQGPLTHAQAKAVQDVAEMHASVRRYPGRLARANTDADRHALLTAVLSDENQLIWLRGVLLPASLLGDRDDLHVAMESVTVLMSQIGTLKSKLGG